MVGEFGLDFFYGGEGWAYDGWMKGRRVIDEGWVGRIEWLYLCMNELINGWIGICG